MPTRNHDLHGNTPDTAPVALLLIDVINDLEFEGGDDLLRHALPAAERIAALKRRARERGIPAIYVNDNFGRWQSDFRRLVDHCLHDGVRGRELAERLAPADDDYFVLKPKHSGFFSTTLETLLRYLEVRTLVLTGFTADYCVLFTANDAYMRDYTLHVPRDCVASERVAWCDDALTLMARVLKADATESAALDLDALWAST
ncbi:MAG: cysteine hydrolase family protein [Gemmatimonadota bacterium]